MVETQKEKEQQFPIKLASWEFKFIFCFGP
jgi:hypothetical protein